jgi:hypothetical protein
MMTLSARRAATEVVLRLGDVRDGLGEPVTMVDDVSASVFAVFCAVGRMLIALDLRDTPLWSYTAHLARAYRAQSEAISRRKEILSRAAVRFDRALDLPHAYVGVPNVANLEYCAKEFAAFAAGWEPPDGELADYMMRLVGLLPTVAPFAPADGVLDDAYELIEAAIDEQALNRAVAAIKR